MYREILAEDKTPVSKMQVVSRVGNDFPKYLTNEPGYRDQFFRLLEISALKILRAKVGT